MNKLILIQRIIALAIIFILIAGLLIFYFIEHYPKVEVREKVKYVDRVKVEKEIVTVRECASKDTVWQPYTVTAYTSLDDGCNSYSAIGLNIEKWSKYFNFCAVDNSLIPYGSVVLVKFDTGIKPFLAVDTGQSITGKHIDLYFVNDLSDAFEFGVQKLPIKVLD
jgi:3D (Asp-Asp-Asp) domain-containing protein